MKRQPQLRPAPQELSKDCRLAYSPAELAALFGRSATWAYRLLYANRIKRLAGNGRILIPKSEIERLLSETTFHE